MSQPYTIIGNYISPYVRKVLVCMELKGLDYRIDPMTPFIGNDDFSRVSPLRRIPVLIDGELVLNDSSVICQYLEDKHAQPALYPADIAQRAKARWPRCGSTPRGRPRTRRSARPGCAASPCGG